MSKTIFETLAALKRDTSVVDFPDLSAHIRVLEITLDDIAKTVCKECGGKGHQRRNCGTYLRIQNSTHGNLGLKSLANRLRGR